MQSWSQFKNNRSFDEEAERRKRSQAMYSQYANEVSSFGAADSFIRNAERIQREQAQLRAQQKAAAEAQNRANIMDNSYNTMMGNPTPQNVPSVKNGMGNMFANNADALNTARARYEEAKDIVMGRGEPTKLGKQFESMNNIDKNTRELFQNAANETDGFKGLKGLSALTKIQEQTGLSDDEMSKYTEDMKKIYKYQSNAKDGLGENYLKSAENDDQYLDYARGELDRLPNDIKNDMQKWIDVRFNHWEGFNAIGYDTDYEKQNGKQAAWDMRKANDPNALKKEIINKYSSKYTPEALEKYFKYAEDVSGKRLSDSTRKMVADDQNGGIAKNYVKYAVNAPSKAINGAINAATELKNAITNDPRGYNRYSLTNMPEIASEEIINQTVNNVIGENHPIKQKLASAGFSTIDSTENALFALATGMPASATLQLMSSSVFTSHMRDAKAKGLDDNTAFKLAFIKAENEAVTEYIPESQLIKYVNKVPVQALVFLGTQMGSEFVEESVNEGLNRLAEYSVIGDTGLSEHDQDVKQIMEEAAAKGMPISEEEARARAEDLFIDKVIDSGIQGAIGGFYSGVGATALGYAKNYAKNTDIKNRRSDLADMYRQEAESINGESRQDRIAKQQAEIYAKNPTRSQVDMMDDTTPEAQIRKADALKIAQKEARGKKLSMSDNLRLNELLGEDNETGFDKYKRYLNDISKNATNGIIESEARVELGKAADAGDINAMADIYDRMKNSSSKDTSNNADAIFNQYVGRAENAGVTAKQIEGAKVTEEEAYQAGLQGLEIDAENLPSFSKEAYNKGTQVRIEERAAQVNDTAKSYGDDKVETAFKNTYDSNISLEQFKTEFDNILNAANSGISYKNIVNSPSVLLLGEEKAKQIYKVGNVNYENEFRARQAKNMASMFGVGDKIGTFEDKRSNVNNDVDTFVYEAIAKVTGYDVVLDNNLSFRGKHQGKGSTVIIRDDSNWQIAHETVGEISKLYATDSFKKASKAALEYGYNVLGEKAYNEEFEKYHNKYDAKMSTLGKTQSKFDSSTEMAMDIMSALLAKDEHRNKFAQFLVDRYGSTQGKHIAQQIYNVYDKIINSIKSLLAKTKMTNVQRKIFESDLEGQHEVIDLFLKAFDEAITKAKSIQPKQNAAVSEDINYSLDLDNKGNDLSEDQIQFYNKAKTRDENGNLKVMYHGTGAYGFDVFDIKKAKASGLYGRGFYFADNDSQSSVYGKTYQVYLNIVDPLVQGTHNITDKQILKFINAIANDEDYGIDNYGYDATPQSILKSLKGKDDFGILQDLNSTCIGDFVGALKLFNKVNGTTYDGIIAPTETVAFYSNQIKDINNKKPTIDDRIDFSLDVDEFDQLEKDIKKSDYVTSDKTLIAVHNLSEENLEGVLELGGLPSPSIAIIKSGVEHSKYGAISMLFKRNAIDPKVSKKNKIYGGDAYTPTFPKVEVKVNDKVAWDINDRLNALVTEADQRSIGYLNTSADSIQDYLNRNNGDAVEAYRNKDIMKLAYIKDKGIDIGDVGKKETRLNSKWNNDQIVEAAKLITAEQAKEFRMNSYGAFESNQDLAEQFRQAMNKQFREKYQKSALKLKVLDKDLYEDFSFNDWDNLTAGINKYYRDGISYESDPTELRKAINDAIDESDYTKWLKDTFKGVIEKKGLRNNRDVFLPSGNRRSWEQLHDEYTLSNVVKIMNQNDSKGADTFFNQSAIQALATKDFKSIEELHENESMLDVRSEEEYDAITQEHSDMFNEICNEIMDKSEKNSFMAHEYAAEAIADAVRKSKTVEGINRVLKEYRTLNIHEDTAQKVLDLMKAISEKPTGYFEAKPRRAVWFEEVAEVIVPDNISKDVLESLEENGLKYRIYESGNEEQRTQYLEQASLEEDAAFSLDTEDSSHVFKDEQGNLKTYESMFDTREQEYIEETFEKIRDKSVKPTKNWKNDDIIVVKSGAETYNKIAFVDSRHKNLRIKEVYEIADTYPYNSESAIILLKEGAKRGRKEFEISRRAILTNGTWGDFVRYTLKNYRLLGSSEIGRKRGESGLYSWNAKGWNFRDESSGIRFRTQFDLDYYRAIQSNDMESAKKIVDTVAKNRGYVKEGNEYIKENGYSKSSEIITRDTNGNIIMPSARFDAWNEDTNFSLDIDVDTEGNELTEGQKKKFANSKVRDENGALEVAYHGSDSFGFSVFDTEKADDRLSTFFTNDLTMAQSYTENKDNVYKVYLNLENPLIVDGHSRKWNDIRLSANENPLVDKIERLIDIEQNYDSEIDIGAVVESAGDLESSASYIIEEADDLFSDEDKAEMLKLAKEIDEAYENFEEYDEDGEEILFEDYVIDNRSERMTTRQIAKYAKANGYDGVIVKNVYDNGKYYLEHGAQGFGNVYIAFNSNQVKSVFNQNPTEDNDINYSLDFDDDEFALFGNNNPTVSDKSILEEGLKALKGKEVNTRAISKIAAELKNEFASTIDQKSFADMLNRAFAYLHSQDNITFNDVMSIFEEIAKPVIDNATRVDNADMYNDFVDYFKSKKIKLSETQMAEIKSAYGSYADFKKAMYPLQFSTNGNMVLDDVWNTLADDFPGLIEYGVTEGDMPLVLADVLESIKPSPTNAFGANAEEVGKDLAMRIVEEYLENQSDARIKKAAEQMKEAQKQYRSEVRDRYKQRYHDFKEKTTSVKNAALEKQKAKYQERLEYQQKKAGVIKDWALAEQRQKYESKLEAEKQNVRDAKEAGRNIRQNYEDRIADIKARAKNQRATMVDRRRAAALKKQISKISLDITNRILNPTEKKHLPSQLVKPLMDFIQGFDFIEPEITYDSESKTYKTSVLEYNDRYNDANHLVKTPIEEATYAEARNRFYEALERGKGTKNQKSWQQRMSAIKDLFDKATNLDGDIGDVINLLDPTMAASLQDVITRNDYVLSINNLSSNDLSVIYNALKSINHAIAEQNKAFTMREDIDKIAHGIGKTAENINVKRKTKFGNDVHNVLVMNMMSPDTFFSMLGNDGKYLYKSLQNAFEKKIRYIQQTEEFFKNLFDGVDVSDWSGEKAQIYTFDTSEGQLQMNAAQIMSLYELSKRQQAVLHLAGGIEVEDMYTKDKLVRRELNQNKGIHVTFDELQKIFSVLTDQQKNIADALQQYMANTCGGWGNEASKIMYDFEKFLDGQYFPISTDPDSNMTKDMDGIMDLLNGIERMGFTKEVSKNASNPIVIHDIINVFVKHATDMATYAAYAPAIKDLLRVYNFKDVESVGENKYYMPVKKAINACMGRQDNAGTEYFKKLLKDINGGERSQDLKTGLDKLVGNYKAAAVGANVRVVAQQPTAIARAAVIIDPKYLLAAKPKNFFHMDELKQKNALIYWKSQGYYETNVGRSIKSIITGNETAREWLTDKSMLLAGWADDITWATIYDAAERKVKAENPGISDEEFRTKVNDLFADVIAQTQVVDATIMKAPWQRSNSTRDKLLTSFMAEPIKAYNIALKSLLQYNRGEVGAKVVVGATAALLVTDMLNSLAQSLVDSFRYHEDDDDYWVGVLDYFLSNMVDNINPLNRIPMIKDVYQSIMDTFVTVARPKVESKVGNKILDLVGSESTYGSTRGQMYEYSALQTAMTALKTWGQIATGEYNKTKYAAYMDSAKAVSQLLGVPVYNFSRDAVSLWNFFNPSERDFVRNLEKPNDIYKNFISILDEDKAEYMLEEAVKKMQEKEGVVKQANAQIKSAFRADYLEAIENGDAERIDEITDKAVRGYMALGMDLDKAEAEVESWTEVTVGYSNLDKAIRSGEGIDEELKIVMDAKDTDKILKHMYDYYATTIELNRERGYDSDIEQNVEYVLKKVDGITFDRLSRDMEAKAKEAAAKKAKSEANKAYKQKVYDSINGGTDYRSAVNEAYKGGMELSALKSAITEEYKEKFLKAVKAGDYATATSYRNRIAAVKAYCDQMSGLKIPKKYGGDYYTYELAQIEEWLKD